MYRRAVEATTISKTSHLVVKLEVTEQNRTELNNRNKSFSVKYGSRESSERERGTEGNPKRERVRIRA
jgi:hypothetical protein